MNFILLQPTQIYRILVSPQAKKTLTLLDCLNAAHSDFNIDSLWWLVMSSGPALPDIPWPTSFHAGPTGYRLKLVICGIIAVCGLTAATWYYATPKYTKIGYEPIQPVPFPHDIHVSQLGMDCRYCHSFVEMAAQSNVPNTQTCMNCHTQVQKDNPKLEPVRASWKTGNPVEWVWIYRTVDYVYYNHAAHVNRGISCFSCHGPVNHMSTVYLASRTAWRGASNAIGTREFPAAGRSGFQSRLETGRCETGGICCQVRTAAGCGRGFSKKQKLSQAEIGRTLKEHWNINPPTNCQGCHR